MPIAYIQKLSKKYNIPIKDLEKIWDKAKELGAKAGHKEDYDYIMGIFKKIIDGKFDIKEQYNNYFQTKNGFIYKENEKWKYQQLDEISIKQWVTIGGIVMLLYNWLVKSSRLMKKMGLKYGDKVKSIEKDSFGKKITKKGLLIKKDGYPQVLIRTENGIISYVKWNENWKKDK